MFGGCIFARNYLAQSNMGQSQGQIIYICLVLVVILVVGMTALAWLRRWSRRNDEVSAAGFTTDSLRKLHKAGKISDEEYKKASSTVKQAMKAQFMAQTTKPAPPAGKDQRQKP